MGEKKVMASGLGASKMTRIKTTAAIKQHQQENGRSLLSLCSLMRWVGRERKRVGRYFFHGINQTVQLTARLSIIDRPA